MLRGEYILNVPNLLTIARIVIAPFVAISIAKGNFISALCLLMFGGLTDIFDGALARLLKQANRAGAYLDPAADKILMLSCYAGLALAGLLPVWLALLVIGRDVIIVGGVAFLKLFAIPFQVAPSKVSKTTTVFQVVTSLFVLLKVVLNPAVGDNILLLLFAVTALLTFVSAFGYIITGWRALRARH